MHSVVECATFARTMIKDYYRFDGKTTPFERFRELLPESFHTWVGVNGLEDMKCPGIFHMNEYKSISKEAEAQKFLYRASVTLGVISVHTPNERVTTENHLMNLHNQGVRPGYPDFKVEEPEVFRSSSLYDKFFPAMGLAIELKVGSNAPSESQIERLTELASRGFVCVVAYSRYDAVFAMLSYLKMINHPSSNSKKYELVSLSIQQAKRKKPRARGLKTIGRMKQALSLGDYTKDGVDAVRKVKYPRGVVRI